jgi:hypothetical protein
MVEITYHTERLDNLGIVADICDDTNLMERIDRLVPASRRQATTGQAVKANLTNSLGVCERKVPKLVKAYVQKPSLTNPKGKGGRT